MFTAPVKDESAENVIQAYLSGILAHRRGSVAILSDNATEFKTKFLMKHVINLELRGHFSNPFYSQGNSRIENSHNFLKQTLTKFLESSKLGYDDLLPCAWYCYNIFPGSNGTESPFFLMFRCDLAEGWLTHINNYSRYYGNKREKNNIWRTPWIIETQGNTLKGLMPKKRKPCWTQS